MKQKILIVLFVLCVTEMVFPVNQGIVFERRSLEQGLDRGTVNRIFRDNPDSRGVLGLGTQGGLNKYDGYTFTLYKLIPFDANRLSNNDIQRIFENRQEQFRIITADAGNWNEKGIAVTITIAPPFWRNVWFWTLVVILIATAALLWHKTRVKNLSRRLSEESALNKFYLKHKISQREQEIIRLIVQGKSNKDIEDELYISIKTVKNHVYNIYKKIGVKNRIQLIKLIDIPTKKV